MNYRKSEAKEASRAQFRGVWAAITTPFTPDDKLDEAGLRRNMRCYTDGLGVDGIFCTRTMGKNPQQVQDSITMAGAAERIKVPLLQIYGGLDKASPPEQAHRVAAEVKGPKTTLVFDDGVHVCNNLHHIVRPLIADWLADHL